MISAIALRSRQNFLKYIESAADLPIDQEAQINFLVRKFNSSALTAAFTMLIGKVAGVSPFFFLPIATKERGSDQKNLIFDLRYQVDDN